MKSKFLKHWFKNLRSVIAGLILFLPKAVLAAAAIDPQQNCDNFKKQFYGAFDWAPKEYCTASGIMLYAIQIALNFAGAVTVLFLVVGGFLYITSAGNEEQAEKGQKIITNAVIGLVVIILSGAIVRIIASVVTAGK